jgi:hypothetical protein
MTSTLNLDTAIPSGSWTLYFHSPEEQKWDISTFIKVGTVHTWRDWFSITDELGTKAINDGMFFFMRDPIPPLWENSRNIRGGSYSYRIQRSDTVNSFMNSAIAIMLDRAMVNPENQINGLSISPKKGFNIIKIWNSDSTRFKTPSDMNQFLENVRLDEIIYTPFLEKKM